MTMKRKSVSTRKPPLPAEGHGDIEHWMSRVMPDLGWVIELAAYDVSVNVVRTHEEAQAAAMNAWIEQAARFTGWQQ